MVTEVSTQSKKTITILGALVEKGAYERAERRILEDGITVKETGREDIYLVSSGSNPSVFYLVSDTGCNCKAAERGLVCKHLIATRKYQIALGLLVLCPDCKTIRRTTISTAKRWGSYGKRGLVRKTCSKCQKILLSQAA